MKTQNFALGKQLKKILCVLLALTMLFGIAPMVVATEGNPPLQIDITTDKASYGTFGNAKVTVTITNTSNETIENISAKADLDGLTRTKGQTEISKTSLASGESFSYDYSVMLGDSSNLNFFQKIWLWVVRVFRGIFAGSAGTSNIDNDIDFVQETIDITFGKTTGENMVTVWFEEEYEDTRYNYTEEDVSYDKDRGIYYINNIILISFKEDVSDERKNEIVKALNGEVVGYIDGLDELHIRLNKRLTISELKILEKKLEEFEEVFYASWDMLNEISVDSARVLTPNDPFRYYDDSSKTWDFEKKIDWDKNIEFSDDYDNYMRIWGQQAIQAPEAWYYNKYFSEINIGIADTGFDTGHEDLENLQIINSKWNRNNNHGTHVAGIIGAKANNNKGIAGINWKASLYGYSVANKKKKNVQTVSDTEVYNGLDELVQKGCKVINFSIGTSTLLVDSNAKKDMDTVEKHAKNASERIAKWLSKGNDFVIVQSAGNGAKDGIGVDAINNGYFCTVTVSNCYDEEENISKKDIMDRIIIVTSADMGVVNGEGVKEYHVSTLANGGNQVSVAAPGDSIYSTVAGIEQKNDFGAFIVTKNQKYAVMNGTSMAAPFVTGVAGLVWSINSSFTGADVKKIVCKKYDETVIVKSNEFPPNATDGFKMVNAKLAVEEALRKSGIEIDIPPTGDDGTTNWDFIKPVTHKKTVPDGYTGIYTAQDLYNISLFNNVSGNYILMNDIDLSDWGYWMPIGYSINCFAGIFDGNGYVIKNMKSSGTHSGLFATMSKGTIKNLGMIGSSIIDSPYYEGRVGGIVGECSADLGERISIINCYNTGDVTTTGATPESSAGGIVGYCQTLDINSFISIIDCYNSGSITSLKMNVFTGITGGIVGSTLGSNIEIINCHNTGNIIGDNVGNLVGKSSLQ